MFALPAFPLFESLLSMYYKNAESLMCHLMSEIRPLMTMIVYGDAVIRDVCKFATQIVKLRKEQYAQKIFNAGKESYSVTIYRMPSGNYEYVGYNCSLYVFDPKE